MKNLVIYISVLFIVSSCEKVIELDLDNAPPKVVIEAELLEGTNAFVTKVSKTGSYFEGQPETISNATVTLNDGTTDVALINNNDGTYSLPSYTASENVTYTLKVDLEGTTYTAESTMPTITNLDTLGFDFQEPSAFTDSGYFCFFVFQDDPQVTNYFRGTVEVDGEFTKGIDDLYYFDDQFTDGNVVIIPVFGEIYQYGQEIKANLHSLNKAGYDYYTTLDNIVGNSGGGNVAPANPKTNWDNGALGVFLTTGVRTKTAFVKQTL